MTDDIVTRLRRDSQYMILWPMVEEAAAEIERLRRNTGCARDQRSTQFCAEALDAQRQVARLTAERDHAVREAAEARQTIFQLRNKLAACCGSGGAGPHTTGPTETFIPEAL